MATTKTRRKRRKPAQTTYRYTVGARILTLEAPVKVIAAARRAHERVFGATQEREAQTL